MSQGVYVLGVYVLGGKCPGGKCPGGICPRGHMSGGGGYVLEPLKRYMWRRPVGWPIQPTTYIYHQMKPFYLESK